jgi:hypothetical protein
LDDGRSGYQNRRLHSVVEIITKKSGNEGWMFRGLLVFPRFFRKIDTVTGTTSNVSNKMNPVAYREFGPTS